MSDTEMNSQQNQPFIKLVIDLHVISDCCITCKLVLTLLQQWCSILPIFTSLTHGD